jgi:hypothetical protein
MGRLGRLIALLILPLIAIIVYSALKSYFFKSPPIWTFEMSLFFFGGFFMLGSAYCHMQKKHVAVDIINHYLPARWRRVQGVFRKPSSFSLRLSLSASACRVPGTLRLSANDPSCRHLLIHTFGGFAGLFPSPVS